jgi:3-hydroxyisobutyrate dehydrogenase-like beta-hydroxyacid dehydrogenase
VEQERTIGLVHPGEMGAAIGSVLVGGGHTVLWASETRSPATAGRAAAAGLTDVGSLDALTEGSNLIISVCPPQAALDVAAGVAAARRKSRPGGWTYIDANAVSPTTAARVASSVASAGGRYVDGGIVGPPPHGPMTTRLYLSGPDALAVSEHLGGAALEVHVLGEEAYAASALKLAYAGWTKGTTALLLAVREAAERASVGAALVEEWRTSQPHLESALAEAERAATTKGWRWGPEMDEVAAMMEDLGLPGGFHRSAATVLGQAGSGPADPRR